MKEEKIEIEGITFKISHINEQDIQQINEAKDKGRSLIGKYSYDIHGPHNPTGEVHLVLYDKGKEILAINKVSGTAHDSYHGIRIPNKAFNALKDKFKDWKWPDNQILESINYTYMIDKSSTGNLRPVRVFKHKNFDLQDIDGFLGFFHQFAEDPFLTGGNGGWKERTIALIETEDGYIRKIPVNCFKFIDSE